MSTSSKQKFGPVEWEHELIKAGFTVTKNTSSTQNRNGTLRCQLRHPVSLQDDMHAANIIASRIDLINFNIHFVCTIYSSGHIGFEHGFSMSRIHVGHITEDNFSKIIDILKRRLFNIFVSNNHTRFILPLRLSSYLKQVTMSDYWNKLFLETMPNLYATFLNSPKMGFYSTVPSIVSEAMTPFICAAIFLEKAYGMKVKAFAETELLSSITYCSIQINTGTITHTVCLDKRLVHSDKQLCKRLEIDITPSSDTGNITSFSHMSRKIDNDLISHAIKMFRDPETQKKTLGELISANKGRITSHRFGI